MAAYLEESNIVLPGHISHAVTSLDHSEMRLQSRFGFVPVSAGIFAALLLIVFAVNFYLPGRRTDAFKESIKKAEINPAQKSIEPVSVSKNNENNKNIISPATSLQKRENTPLTPLDRGELSPSPPASQQEVQQTFPYKILSVKVDVANVRDEPGLDSVAVGKLLKSDQMVAYQEYSDESGSKWYQVSFRGEKRWIAEEVVDVLAPVKSEGQQTN